MSNRHQRRADVRAFRHQVHRDHILTHLLDANADLSRHPLFSKAKATVRVS